VRLLVQTPVPLRKKKKNENAKMITVETILRGER
jgi:hypothetical protein